MKIFEKWSRDPMRHEFWNVQFMLHEQKRCTILSLNIIGQVVFKKIKKFVIVRRRKTGENQLQNITWVIPIFFFNGPFSLSVPQSTYKSLNDIIDCCSILINLLHAIKMWLTDQWYLQISVWIKSFVKWLSLLLYVVRRNIRSPGIFR